jgi:hypothetical protein
MDLQLNITPQALVPQQHHSPDRMLSCSADGLLGVIGFIKEDSKLFSGMALVLVSARFSFYSRK